MVWPSEVLQSDTSFVFGLYLAVGVLAYSFLEHWNVTDTIYFLLVACTTVGFGDFVPHTDAAKVFTAVYVPIGIICVIRAFYSNAQMINAMLASYLGAVGSGRGGKGPVRLTQPEDTADDAFDYMRAATGPLLWVGAGTALGIFLLHFSYVDAFYFASTSIALVGFGDLPAASPFSPIGRYAVAALLVVGSMQSIAALEQAWQVYARRQIKSTPLNRLIEQVRAAHQGARDARGAGPAARALTDPLPRPRLSLGQVVLQESCWDSSWESDEHVAMSKASPDSEGLSEAEFLLAALTAHGAVDVPTLVALRKQFRALMTVAERQRSPLLPPSAPVPPPAAAPSAMASDGMAAPTAEVGGRADEGASVVRDGDHQRGALRLDARAVFDISVSEQRVRQRSAEAAPGATDETVYVQHGAESRAPVPLVDLGAADGGYAEWLDHFWSKQLSEARQKVAEAYGQPTSAAAPAAAPGTAPAAAAVASSSASSRANVPML